VEKAKWTFLLLLLLAPSLAWADASPDYRDMGMALYQKGLYSKSVDYFNRAVQNDPGDWQAYADLGDAYMKLNKNPQALWAYEKSLQLHPGHSAVQSLADALKADGTTAAAPESASSEIASPPQDQSDQALSQAPPALSSRAEAVEPMRRWRPRLRIPQYKDGLAPMDHARFWSKLEVGYDFSSLDQLTGSADATNQEDANGNLFYGFTDANAQMANSGYLLGAEWGFLLNPRNGLAIGIRYVRSTNYTLSALNSAPSTVSGAPSDYENASFSPYLFPITLDYYLFFPDGGGRFFVSAGVGYYVALVHVNENYSLSNYADDYNAYGNPVGDLSSGNIGFQLGIGREFAVTPRFGISLFARGHYSEISDIRGRLSDGYTYALVQYSDKTVDIDDPANIGISGEKYATLDYFGFDVGLSLNWYTF
jgi:tetratricopeptide (TPR) repeat protein